MSNDKTKSFHIKNINNYTINASYNQIKTILLLFKIYNNDIHVNNYIVK